MKTNGVSIIISFLSLAAYEVFANCPGGPYNPARFFPGRGVTGQFARIQDGITDGRNNGCDYGPSSGEFSSGMTSAPHIFGVGRGFGPIGHVSGVGAPNNFFGSSGYPGNPGAQGPIGELSYLPGDATNPMLNFWGGSFPPEVNGVPGNLGGGPGGFGFDASQGGFVPGLPGFPEFPEFPGFPGFHGFGEPPGLFGPPIGNEVAGQDFRGLNGQPAAVASPPGEDTDPGQNAGGSRLLDALETGKRRGSIKKSGRQSSRNTSRNRNANMNYNQA